jgi:outer membrane protein insertion porin family
VKNLSPQKSDTMFKDYKRFTLLLSALLFLLLFSDCTGLKSVGDGSYLYRGFDIRIDSTQFLANKSAAKSELDSLITVKPNSKLLWMRPWLSIYNLIPEPKKKKGWKYWLKYKLGEPPALLADIDLQNTVAAIENRLQNRGNFKAKAGFEVISKTKTAKVKFIVSPGKPYTLKEIKYPQGKNGIAGDIAKLQPGSILKKGKTYSLKDFENERKRIEGILKEKGYYYFKADNIIFKADTTVGTRQLNARLNLKPEMPAEASTAFRFNKIYVSDDYSILNYHPDTIQVGKYSYISENHQFKPKTILNAVFFERDSLYSRTDHYNTLRHLMGIGAFKYANAAFKPDKSLPELMNVNVFLTPLKKISLSAEINAAYNTNNFAGPGINLIFKNRNVFGGAELLSVTLGGKFETQVKGDSKGQTSYQTTLDAALTFPKFVPFRLDKKTSKISFPKTTLNGGFGIYSEVNLYQLHSFNTSVGYSWKPRENITHIFRPIDVSYTHLVESSAEFDDYLEQNPTIARSFEDQFILGCSYNFLNSNIYLQNRKHRFYLSESLDLAGNLASLYTTLINGSPPTPENPYKLLGLPYSQFVRIGSEFRYFYTPAKKSQLAWRLFAGVGIPYGNSSTIPYIRQYYAGGTNSIRAFIARSVGPGTFKPPDGTSNIYIDQAGDIKFETNLEYRFDIYKYFKGALFTDVGNIWLVNEDPQRAGGKFNYKTFYKEFAVGSGFGFRFDFNFIILRIDLAIPLRKPYLPEGERWVVDEIDLGSSSWRHDNIVWNFAIGYPF